MEKCVCGVEFKYNNSVNRLMGMSPFDIVQGRSLHGVTDLMEVPTWTHKSANVELFFDHMKEIHD